MASTSRRYKAPDWKLLTFEPNTGCWLWTGALSRDGYGGCSRLGEWLIHRAAYVHAFGSIPEDTEIDHLCRVRSCANPAHLEAVPHVLNVKRGVRVRERHRNGRKTHCKRGHELVGDNLIVEGSARKCRMCRTERMRARRGGLSGFRGPAKVNLYCRRGHPMFGPDLRFNGGERYCWRCGTIKHRAWRERRRSKSSPS